MATGILYKLELVVQVSRPVDYCEVYTQAIDFDVSIINILITRYVSQIFLNVWIKFAAEKLVPVAIIQCACARTHTHTHTHTLSHTIII